MPKDGIGYRLHSQTSVVSGHIEPMGFCLFVCLFLRFLFLRETERDHEQGGGTEGKGEGEAGSPLSRTLGS